ncbi:MAG: sel1 repeat family protein [Rhizobiaceae bacterium]|nr:sel1 repeat family protein [Rhizobiaceae bacterium]
MFGSQTFASSSPKGTRTGFAAICTAFFLVSTMNGYAQQVDYDKIENFLGLVRAPKADVEAVLAQPRYAEVRAIAQRAAAGDAESQLRLAGCFSNEKEICDLPFKKYYELNDVIQEKAESAWWALQAARQGSAVAHAFLGDKFAYGIKIEEVVPTSENLRRLEEIEQRVSQNPQFVLGEREQLVQALSLYDEARRLGFPVTDFVMGGIKWDIDRLDLRRAETVIANRKFDEAMNRVQQNPDAAALYDLAMLYRHGHKYDEAPHPVIPPEKLRSRDRTAWPDQTIGKPRDVIAAQLFSQAARLDHPAAQYELGMMFYFGSGVDEDRKAAMNLLSLAGLAGNADAEKVLNNELRRAEAREQRAKARAALVEAGILVLQKIGEQAAFTAKVAPSVFGNDTSSDQLNSTWGHIGAAQLTIPSLNR